MKSLFHSLFGLAIFAIGVGAHLAVLTWAERAWPKVRRWRRWLVGACVVLSAAPGIARQVTLATRDTLADAVNAASMFELTFVVTVAAPLFVLTAWHWWVAKRVTAPPSRPTEPASEPAGDLAREPLTRRDALHTIGGATAFGVTGALLGWGATRGRHDFQLFEVPVRIPGLPKALDGYVIGQVSDIHTGLFVGDRELKEGLDRARAFKPDLLVVTGDLVDFDARETARLGRALADLAPRDGIVGILGNHDYYAGAPQVTEAMRRAGLTMLVNESRMMRAADGGGFALLGVDDEWAWRFGGRGRDLGRASAGIAPGVPRILLAHQPSTFHVAHGKVALQLSGHTHGGQIRPADLLLRWSAGRYEKDGSTLYVNRGFGVAGPPARLGVPPEVTKIVLVAA